MSAEHAMALKMQRNLILSTLRACWPGSYDGERIYLILIDRFPEYNRLDASKDFAYLEQKGYAIRKHPMTRRQTTDPLLRWNKADWCLTVRGTEIADDLDRDPALEL